MKLQLSLDLFDFEQSIKIAEETRDCVDILEIGTPFITYNGITLIEKFKMRFPEKKILVDLKLADVGEYEAEPFLQAGADIITVLATADDTTIALSCLSAKRTNAEIMVDFINVRDLKERYLEIEKLELPLDYLAIHWGIDHPGVGLNLLLSNLSFLRESTDIPIEAIGGINLNNVHLVAPLAPAIVGVGRGITRAENPRKAALAIRNVMDVFEQQSATKAA